MADLADRAGLTGRERTRSEYARIVVEVRPLLVHRALRMTGDRDLASDLVQATLEKGYRSFAQFRTGTSAANWLSAIMTNHFIDEIRREKALRHRVPIETLEIAAPTPEKVPAWRALHEEEVREAAARLPAHCREPFELFSFHRVPYREIAARLDLPLNTVCTRIHRARRLLRRILLGELVN